MQRPGARGVAAMLWVGGGGWRSETARRRFGRGSGSSTQRQHVKAVVQAATTDDEQRAAIAAICARAAAVVAAGRIRDERRDRRAAAHSLESWCRIGGASTGTSALALVDAALLAELVARGHLDPHLAASCSSTAAAAPCVAPPPPLAELTEQLRARTAASTSRHHAAIQHEGRARVLLEAVVFLADAAAVKWGPGAQPEDSSAALMRAMTERLTELARRGPDHTHTGTPPFLLSKPPDGLSAVAWASLIIRAVGTARYAERKWRDGAAAALGAALGDLLAQDGAAFVATAGPPRDAVSRALLLAAALPLLQPGRAAAVASIVAEALATACSGGAGAGAADATAISGVPLAARLASEDDDVFAQSLDALFAPPPGSRRDDSQAGATPPPSIASSVAAIAAQQLRVGKPNNEMAALLWGGLVASARRIADLGLRRPAALAAPAAVQLPAEELAEWAGAAHSLLALSATTAAGVPEATAVVHWVVDLLGVMHHGGAPRVALCDIVAALLRTHAPLLARAASTSQHLVLSLALELQSPIPVAGAPTQDAALPIPIAAAQEDLRLALVFFVGSVAAGSGTSSEGWGSLVGPPTSSAKAWDRHTHRRFDFGSAFGAALRMSVPCLPAPLLPTTAQSTPTVCVLGRLRFDAFSALSRFRALDVLESALRGAVDDKTGVARLPHLRHLPAAAACVCRLCVLSADTPRSDGPAADVPSRAGVGLPPLSPREIGVMTAFLRLASARRAPESGASLLEALATEWSAERPPPQDAHVVGPVDMGALFADTALVLHHAAPLCSAGDRNKLVAALQAMLLALLERPFLPHAAAPQRLQELVAAQTIDLCVAADCAAPGLPAAWNVGRAVTAAAFCCNVPSKVPGARQSRAQYLIAHLDRRATVARTSQLRSQIVMDVFGHAPYNAGSP